jgi:hypothetical protein
MKPNLEQLIQKQKEEFVEKGANLEHDRWARWQKYMHSHVYDSSKSINPHLKVIPTELYERWERQIATPYSELSEKEKESDRKETREYLALYTSSLKSLLGALVEREEKEKIIPVQIPHYSPYLSGHNDAKKDTIANLKELIKSLEGNEK